MIPLFESVVNFTDLRAYLAIAIKHARLMVLCFCLGLTLGLVYLVYATTVYYSKSLIRVISFAPLPVDAEVVFRDSNLSSLIAQLYSPHLAERTGKKLGIKGSGNKVIQSCFKKIRITVNSQRDIELELWPYNYWLGREWPSVLVNEYLIYRDEKRFEQRERLVKSFTEEMAQIRAKIEEFEKSKAYFKDSKELDENKRFVHELSLVPVRLATVNDKIAFLTSIKNKIENDKLTVTEQLSVLSSAQRRSHELDLGNLVAINPTNTAAASLPATRDIVVTPDVIAAGEPWKRLEKDQRRLQQQLQEAEKIYLPGHEKIVSLKKELDKVNTELAMELDLSKKRFFLELSALTSEKQDVDKQFADLQDRLKKDASLSRQMTLIQAGRLSWESMYSQVASALEKLDFGGDKERVDIQFMGLLEYKDSPVSPYRRKVFLLSLLLGLGFAVAVPFFLEYLDDTITVDEQVERHLGIKTIGIIPQIAKDNTRDQPINLLEGDHDRRLTEYFRVIRVNLLSNVDYSGARQVFMISSALPKEGKSIIAFNLAVAFAKLGDSTLLIDADLRRGTLHRIFNVSSKPGLSQILTGECSPESTITTPVSNLAFLPCGRHTHSPSELLESEGLANLMKTLRTRYVRIVLDTPPILGLSETSSMLHVADGVVMVLWSGNTASKAVKTAKSMLDAKGAKYFGCIMNKLDLSSATAYYYYYYYSYKYYQDYHKIDGESKAESPSQDPSADA